MGIELINLTKKYGDKTLFESFSYSFPNCGIYQIAGDSGIGKTTLLRIISGLDKTFEGTIISENKFAFVFQEYRLFQHLNAMENVMLVINGKTKENAAHTAKDILYALSFTEQDIELYPNELSGGMKQRVAIARAMASDFDVMILDEPFKELDKTLARKVFELIEEISKDKLVILTSHDELPIQAVPKENIIAL